MQLITYTSRLYSIHIPTTPMPKEEEEKNMKQEKLEKA